MYKDSQLYWIIDVMTHINIENTPNCWFEYTFFPLFSIDICCISDDFISSGGSSAEPCSVSLVSLIEVSQASFDRYKGFFHSKTNLFAISSSISTFLF